MPVSPLCRKCGRLLDKMLVGEGREYHPNCQPTSANERLSFDLLSDLTDVIIWTDNNSARSVQATIGPSELGGDCDRRIAYRLAGVGEVNQWRDPLPAIVGTAVHAWLEKAVNAFQATHFMDRWLTETTVHPDRLVKGHCDLYDKDLRAIIDWKTVSPTRLKEWKSKGPSDAYIDQVNLYGKGMIAAGYPVEKVCLIAVPRAGGLKDMQCWLEDYQPERAQKALDRMYGIARTLITMGDDLSLESIPAAPGSSCSYCPWYRGGTNKADLSGCSGNSVASAAKFGKGMIKDA